MTAAEENVLRVAINPWPLSLKRIAIDAGRSQDTTRKHLKTLARHRMVEVYDIAGGKRAWMATGAGHGAIMSIDDMRGKG